MPKYINKPLNCVCAAHSDLHSVALLRLLSFPLSVPQLGLRLLQAPLGDFPECMDLVPLQLEVAPLLPFPVQLLSEANDVLLQLEVHRQVCQFELKIDDVSTIWPIRAPVQASCLYPFVISYIYKSDVLKHSVAPHASL